MSKIKTFTADFETTTDENDCRVWAFGTCEIGGDFNFNYGNNIDDFISWCANPKENYTLYFHNLKFDGEFIFNYLLTHAFQFIQNKSEKANKTFTCLISDMGQFYSIEIYFKVGNKKVNKVTIYDSLKILDFSVKEIAESFNLEIKKGEIDYDAYRKPGHILTDEEVAYLKNDVEIVARALKHLFDENLTHMTMSSNAIHNYEKLIGSSWFDRYYPKLRFECDLDIRQSYRGGFTYVNPYYKEKTTKSGIVLDVNSLYPSVMYNELLPFGEPIFFDGQYKDDKLYPLYIQMLTCTFHIKKNKIPTIQLKGNFAFSQNEYIEHAEDVTICLTSVDLELFFEQYDVTDIIYHSGWKFKGVRGLFSEYIDYWTKKKIEAKKEGNRPQYLIAKKMLNSLYGKFAMNMEMRSKIPYYDEDLKIIRYKLSDKEIVEGIYLPTATFITSYARRKTISTSQKIRDYSLEKYGVDYYVYSDTDSIHCLFDDTDEIKNFVDVDSYKLGAWDWEMSFDKGTYIRQKCYLEIESKSKELKVTCAGMPKACIKFDKKEKKYFYNEVIRDKNKNIISETKKEFTFETFKKGFTCGGKLTFKHVPGGVILIPTEFTIKA